MELNIIMVSEPSFSGSLVAIGGNEDKSEDLIILKRIIQEISKSDYMVGIITTASEDSENRGRDYHKVFTSLGASKIEILNIKKRSQANDNKIIKKIDDADLIFLTGGDQLRLTSVLGGSQALEAIQKRLDTGAIVAGTSAGAAAFSDTMIYEGSSEEGLFKGSVLSTPGFGFVKNIIFDTHFMSRGRIGRLVQIITTNPICIGVGISENSGVILKGDGNAEVVGTGQVIIVDGRDIGHSNIMNIKPGEPISVENVRIHSLVSGYGYNFKNKIFLTPTS
jgi:cyanophycinase